MKFFVSVKKISKSAPFWIAAFWALILLANFVSIIPQPATIIGYLWKVEFAFALFLLIALIFALKSSNAGKQLLNFSKQEFYTLILPVVLFMIWSGFSAFWANAPRNAVHHTLLWMCYGIFYILARIIVKDARLLDISFKFTGVVIAVLGLACLTEFFSSETLTQLFTYRYYKYAEALAVLLPVYAALAMRKNSRNALVSGGIAAVCWTVIVISLSRTVFLAGLAGIGLFFLIAVFNYLKKNSGAAKFDFSLKKAFLFVGLLAVVTVMSQISFSGTATDENTTVKRFTSNEHGQYTFQSRLLDWGIALEMFKMNPANGNGADNFVTTYRTAHENYSLQNPNNELLKLDETILPERAHNEYLQILAELGIVGSLFFLWFLFGIGGLLFAAFRQKKISIVSIGAFAGIAAFLVSSLASSYSFRVPANGICFFFVLALAVEGLLKDKKKLAFDFVKIKPAFAYGSLAICVLMIVFSSVRGTSLMFLQMSAFDKDTEERNLKTALALDENDALINYYYGLYLHNESLSEKAIPHLRKAIDNGLATSVGYYQLYTAQTSARRDAEAEKTLEEALRVFPQSVFLLTAHAAHLQKTDNFVKSEIELTKAMEINPQQAESWWIAQTEGTAKLTIDASGEETLVEVMDLKPSEAIFSVLDFQRRNNPKLVMR